MQVNEPYGKLTNNFTSKFGGADFVSLLWNWLICLWYNGVSPDTSSKLWIEYHNRPRLFPAVNMDCSKNPTSQTMDYVDNDQ
jgi:hypothetical protein